MAKDEITPPEELEDVEAEEIHKPESSAKNDESIKDKISQKLNKENMENLYEYAKENTLDTVGYVILIIGLVLLFFLPFYGQILVGVVAGFFFSDELIRWTKKWQNFIDRFGMVKSIVFAGTLIALFIRSPMLFIGAGIIAGLKYLFLSEKR